MSGIFKELASFPGAVALFGVLYQVWRNERAQERAVELQNKQQDFVLGTASHMANVAYDKHVLFCEEYINRVQETFQKLMQNGPTKEALGLGGDLLKIRIKHSPWLTAEIEKKLKPFETALIQIGSKEHLLEYLPTGEQRTKVVEEVFRFFELILGERKTEKEEEVSMARDVVVEEIREILGVKTLTALRKNTGELALERMRRFLC